MKFCSGAVRSDHKSDARCNFLLRPRNVIIPEMRNPEMEEGGWLDRSGENDKVTRSTSIHHNKRVAPNHSLPPIIDMCYSITQQGLSMINPQMTFS